MNTTLLLYIAIGSFAGILSGMIGIGGGIVIVPALVLVAGFPQLMATGTSLAVLLLPIGLAAVLQYYHDGNVNVQAASIIAVSFALCAWFGAIFAKKIPPQHLRLVFGISIMIIGSYIAYTAFKKINP